MKRFLLILLILYAYSPFTKAAIITGCQATLGSNTIYYTRDGNLTVGANIPQYRNDNFTNGYQLSDVTCYSGLGSGQGSCFIKGYSGPGDAFGTLVTFSLYYSDCPLDDGVPLLMICLVLLYIFRIKKDMYKTRWSIIYIVFTRFCQSIN